MSSLSDIGDSIYSGTATLGRVRAIVFAVIFTILAIILIFYGVKNLLTKDKLTSTVPGVVTKIECQNGQHICDLEVEYHVNDKVYVLKEINSALTMIPQVNQTVTVYFDPENPNSARAEELTPKQLGTTFIVGAFVLLLLSWVGVWLTQKFKFYAAAQGTGTIFDLVRNI